MASCSGCCVMMSLVGAHYSCSRWTWIQTNCSGSGELLWRYEIGSYVSRPTLRNGIVFVGGVGDSHPYLAHALDAQTGEFLWSYDFGIHPVNQVFVRSDGIVYVATTHALDALDEQTGDLIRRSRGDRSAAMCRPRAQPRHGIYGGRAPEHSLARLTALYAGTLGATALTTGLERSEESHG